MEWVGCQAKQRANLGWDFGFIVQQGSTAATSCHPFLATPAVVAVSAPSLSCVSHGVNWGSQRVQTVLRREQRCECVKERRRACGQLAGATLGLCIAL